MLTISGIFFAKLFYEIDLNDMDVHNKFMLEALKEAQKARAKDEVPIGAVIVCEGRIIARAHNLTESLNDPTAHAEMQAITAATAFIGGKYLNQCTLYVTLEPCPMCAGALFWSQIGSVIYGASDIKRGYSTISKSMLHPKTQIVGGVLSIETGDILKKYFEGKR
jgi:tRNA(adenine34) deaminase